MPKDALTGLECISFQMLIVFELHEIRLIAGRKYDNGIGINLFSFVHFPEQALWLQPDDHFCTEMLSLALADEARGPQN